MDYPLPPWLSPQAAQGWGELALGAAKSRANIQMERDRLAQQSAQFAIESQQRAQQLAQENQARADALNYDHTVEQQKIAIDQAYKQQVVGLKTQDLDLAQKRFEEQTATAAKRFSANQLFQKAMLPVEQGGEGLAPDKAALKYIAPYMTGTEVGKMAAAPAPFTMGTPSPIPNIPGKLGVETSRGHFQIVDAPSSATNAPKSMPVTGDDGTIGYWVSPPGGGKPHWQPVQKTSSDTDLRDLIKKRAGGGDKPARKAEGGYTVGALYKGGLRYLGGPPSDEASWEKVK